MGKHVAHARAQEVFSREDRKSFFSLRRKNAKGKKSLTGFGTLLGVGSSRVLLFLCVSVFLRVPSIPKASHS